MTYPPRTMTKATAAAYCDISKPAFDREVTAGRLPQPVMFGGKEHWDRKAIDAALDALTGVANDWRSRSPLYASEAR